MSTDPSSTANASTRPPLRVALVVAAPQRLTPRDKRLLGGLCADPRFQVTLHAADTAGFGPPNTLPMATQALLAVEQALVAVPRRNPPADPPSLPCGTLADIGACDVIVDLADVAGLPGTAPGRARLGVWRLAPLPGEDPVAATMAGRPRACIGLYQHLPGLAPGLVATAIYDTKPLASLSQAFAAEKSAQLVLRELARAWRDGHAARLAPPAPAPSGQASLTGYGLRLARHVVGRALRRIGARLGRPDTPFALRTGTGTLPGFDPAATRPLPMPRGRFWADPFLIDHDGQTWCFFEEVHKFSRKGHISAGRLTDNGVADVRPVLQGDAHMSYPFVFRHGDDILLMPESHNRRRLEIWRARQFPDQWDLWRTAFEGTPVVDSVLFDNAGQWWLFTHISRDTFGDFCSDLHLFMVDGPALSRITPHPLNPVVIDSSSARGAGRVIAQDGRIFRLSQDNSGGVYGYGLNVMEITSLSPTDYAERRARHVTPDFVPGLAGCHHYDQAGGRFIIDARLG